MAKTWYTRYLKHYSTHARKDKIYSQYAELLADNKQYALALKNYELAAYDGDIILDKHSAYATIVLTRNLYYSTDKTVNKNEILNKHIKYSLTYSQLYINEKNAGKIILHASELAYRSKQFNKAIEISSLISDSNNSSIVFKSNLIKAHSYFSLSKFSSAEDAYTEALSSMVLSKKEVKKIQDKIALSIYKQGSEENDKNNVELALHHYLRITSVVPASSIAATGLYDGIALAMKNNLWTVSIDNIKVFQQRYPSNKFNQDLTRKLSVAYLKSDQGIKAAREFEKISGFGANREVAIAALWQASELYEEKNDYVSALNSYEKYVKKYKTPYPQYMEALNKLVDLNKKQNNNKNSLKWQYEIIKADKNTSKSVKTDRTKFIASSTSLDLARRKLRTYESYKLVAPLKRNLRLKKSAMQKSVKLFGRASVYGIPETSTEATYSIAEIYNSFSKALLTSERPRHLNKDEIEQYVILIEDKAFPFEEKAIEFHEINLAHTRDGIYNDWIKKSHEQLKVLFPVRYKRKAKLDGYINVLH
jgi:outer membrane protein assembly factor BamD (BamD/ComL family)